MKRARRDFDFDEIIFNAPISSGFNDLATRLKHHPISLRAYLKRKNKLNLIRKIIEFSGNSFQEKQRNIEGRVFGKLTVIKRLESDLK